MKNMNRNIRFKTRVIKGYNPKHEIKSTPAGTQRMTNMFGQLFTVPDEHVWQVFPLHLFSGNKLFISADKLFISCINYIVCF